MKNLHITVTDKIATYLHRDGAIVCGNSDYQLVFSFDAEWTGKTKTVRFRWGSEKTDVKITSGDTCTVPVIKDADSVVVGVYATNNLSTTPVIIPCKRSILCSG